MPPSRPRIVAAFLLVALAPLVAIAQDVPSPEQHLGYPPGADNHLATWATVVDYFAKLDAASDRVAVETLGESTEGRPMIAVVISAAETIAKLPDYKALQRRLALPDEPDADRGGPDPVAASKAVVLITCTIHSTETASTFMALELAHQLATADDPATRAILDRTILVLVPSVNPDGVDIVHDWYERTKGKPWEGSGLPKLYHKYAGHDTNRDWYMLNLKETQLLTKLLYREWFPTLTYDVHQMGSAGARLFVPPFFDPVNPNLDPRVSQGIFLIGAHMAADLAVAGKKGILTNAMYDNWWNGGNRTVPQRHNMVGVLTEAASVRLASPIFLEKSELRGSSRGFADHQPAINFIEPWPGGWWRLRDIVDYELICARSILTLAARYKDDFQSNYRAMARDAVAKGRDEPPFAWVVPADQADPGSAADLVRILHDTGIRVRRAESPFTAAGVEYPAGSFILPASQPYRAHLKDMMERQDYPQRLRPDGSPEPPYDVAGWTLPLLMGVEATTIAAPFEAEARDLAEVKPPAGVDESKADDKWLTLDGKSLDDLRLVFAMLEAGVDVRRARRPTYAGDDEVSGGSWLIRSTDTSRRVINENFARLSSRIGGLAGPIQDPTLNPGFDAGNGIPAKQNPPRIAVYQPWVPSMDEGWTRLVLEQHGVPYQSLHNDSIRAGGLRERFDTILIPSIGARTLRDGYDVDETEPAYAGGLGREGADALRAFVEDGGVLVCLEDSCLYAIDELQLPVKEVVRGLKSSEFYCPGSILRLEYPRHGGTEDPGAITLGQPPEGPAYFAGSLAFEVDKGHEPAIVARYAGSKTLESGWLLGADKIQGKAALVDLPLGTGRVILFAFPPQHRGQTRATFRPLLQALLLGGLSPADRH